MLNALPAPVLPKRLPHEPAKSASAIRVSPLLVEAAGEETDEVLLGLHTSKDGLTTAEAEQRSREYGPNIIARRLATRTCGCWSRPRSTRW